MVQRWCRVPITPCPLMLKTSVLTYVKCTWPQRVRGSRAVHTGPARRATAGCSGRSGAPLSPFPPRRPRSVSVGFLYPSSAFSPLLTRFLDAHLLPLPLQGWVRESEVGEVHSELRARVPVLGRRRRHAFWEASSGRRGETPLVWPKGQ